MRDSSSAAPATAPLFARLFWVGLHLALTALALTAYHTILLKLYLDTPFVMGGLLAGILVVVLGLRAIAARYSVLSPRLLVSLWTSMRSPNLVFLVTFLVCLFVFHFTFMRAASDGRAYFSQVRSLVIDGDLHFENEKNDFGFGGGVDDFAFGTPLLWTPFFVAGHAWLGVMNLFGADYSRDGYFNPYQRAVGLGTVVYGIAALYFVYVFTAGYFRKRLALLATLVLCFGSFVIWYIAVDASYSHATSMLTTTLFLLAWDRTRGQRTTRGWTVLGGLAGLMTMTRWQNSLFLIVPAFESFRDYWRAYKDGSAPAALDLLSKNAVFVTATAVAFFPQLLVWKVERSGWFDLPVADHDIRWLSPDVGRELFYPDRGLFTWTPLLALAMLGVLLFTYRKRFVGSALLAAFTAQLYISSTILSIGHGHGARKFTNCAVIFAIGIAALLEWARRRPLAAPLFIAGVLIVVNGFFMVDLYSTDLQQSGAVSFDRMVRSTTSRIGNPFALPLNMWIAWKYDADLTLYERLGSQVFNNVHINFGTPGDGRFLGRGWSIRETGSDGTFRWAVGLESTIVVRLRASDVYALDFRAAPFSWDEGPSQLVEAWVNGHSVERLALPRSGLTDYRVIIPRDFIRAGLNEIRLKHGYARPPLSLGISDDPRELAARYYELHLMRNPR